MKFLNTISALSSVVLIIMALLSFLNVDLPNVLIIVLFFVAVLCFLPIIIKWNFIIISEYGFSNTKNGKMVFEIFKIAFSNISKNRIQFVKALLWIVFLICPIFFIKSGSYSLKNDIPNNIVGSTYLFLLPFVNFQFAFGNIMNKILNNLN